MNSTGLTGMALVVLGLAGVFSTGALTAAIPAILGLIFLGLALWARNPARARAAGAAAAGLAALGILAALGRLAPRLLGGLFPLDAAAFANISMALICALYLAFWLMERSGPWAGGARR